MASCLQTHRKAAIWEYREDVRSYDLDQLILEGNHPEGRSGIGRSTMFKPFVQVDRTSEVIYV